MYEAHPRRMSTTRSQVLSLYKRMLREAKKFPDYNFRMYALRRIQDGFHANKDITDSAKRTQLMKDAEDDLKIMQRQVIVGQLYGEGKLVIESQSNTSR